MFRSSFWTQPRIEAFLDAVPDDRMLVLDLFCESTPMWSRTEAFCGKPWLWCNVQNFGCTVHLGGALDRNNAGLNEARQDPHRGELVGLGFVNEGLGYNPVAYDLMFEMAWRDKPSTCPQWMRNYSRHRYGRANPDAEAAWAILKDTVYTAPHRTRSIIDHVPSLEPAGGVPYDNVQLAGAWRHLLRGCGRTGRGRHLPIRPGQRRPAGALQPCGRAASQGCRGPSLGRRRSLSKPPPQDFLQLMRDMDELLATRPEFLLGRWLEDAKRWGTTDAERAKFEWNARRVLTLWGTGKSIRDYARKEWSGMISGFYLKRWEWFLREQAEALADNEPMDVETVPAGTPAVGRRLGRRA